MTFLVERLAELRRHLDHLRALRPRVATAEALARDLSLHNDVLFSLLSVCQLVVDIAGELAARRGARYESYGEAVRQLGAEPGIPAGLAAELVPLAGFRNVLLHEYVTFDLERAIEALDRLEPVERLLAAVSALERRG